MVNFVAANSSIHCCLDVIIGFERVTYSVNESAPSVVIAVILTDGELGRTVMLDMFTMNGTAQRMPFYYIYPSLLLNISFFPFIKHAILLCMPFY